MAVYFKVVESRTFWYFFVKAWLRPVFRYGFYKKVYVRGRENIPPEGTPILLVSNHQNGIMDALLIDFVGLPLKYKMVFLARGDAFKRPFIAKLLNFAKVMPVYRQRDGRESLGENQAIFEESAKLISMGFPVALFPEGRHQEGHYMIPLKKGFARIAFGAAELLNFPENLQIVPVGNHYHDYFALRSKVLLSFGKPVALKNYYGLWKENQPRALSALAADITPAMRNLMLDIPDTEHYETYNFLRDIVRPAVCRLRGLRENYLPHMLDADRIWADRIRESPPETMAAVREDTALVGKEVKAMGISPAEALKPAGIMSVLSGFILILAGSAFALYGICFTGLPVLLGHNLAHKMARKNIMLQSSFDFVLSQIVFQLFTYVLYTVVYWIFFAHWGVWVFLGLLLSWMLTRAFWQDYVHFAAKVWRRFKSLFYRRRIAALRPVIDRLNAWATGGEL